MKCILLSDCFYLFFFSRGKFIIVGTNSVGDAVSRLPRCFDNSLLLSFRLNTCYVFPTQKIYTFVCMFKCCCLYVVSRCSLLPCVTYNNSTCTSEETMRYHNNEEQINSV
jgi:hypothetical protein